jgi:hypothetical protein
MSFHSLLTFLLLLAASFAAAQDRITLKNGNILDPVRITSIEPGKVVYEQHGSLHDLHPPEVLKIEKGDSIVTFDGKGNPVTVSARAADLSRMAHLNRGWENREVVMAFNFSPLTLLDQNGVQLGLEVPLDEEYSFLGEVAYLFRHSGFGLNQKTGFTVKSEIKYHYTNRRPLLAGWYLALQGFYKHLDFVESENEKDVFSVNFKAGYMGISQGSGTVDVYGGLGIRQSTTQSHYAGEQTASSMLVPNITLGVRVGLAVIDSRRQ